MIAIMKDLASTSSVHHSSTPFSTAIKRNKWDPLVFKCCEALRYWNNMEICFKSFLQFVCSRDVKNIKIYCERYLYLCKRTIVVEMGPVSSYNVAPTFYGTQCGWLILQIYTPLVFYHMTTSTTSIKVMEDCSTITFVQAFTPSHHLLVKSDIPNLS